MTKIVDCDYPQHFEVGLTALHFLVCLAYRVDISGHFIEQIYQVILSSRYIRSFYRVDISGHFNKTVEQYNKFKAG